MFLIRAMTEFVNFLCLETILIVNKIKFRFSESLHFCLFRVFCLRLDYKQKHKQKETTVKTILRVSKITSFMRCGLD